MVGRRNREKYSCSSKERTRHEHARSSTARCNSDNCAIARDTGVGAKQGAQTGRNGNLQIISQENLSMYFHPIGKFYINASSGPGTPGDFFPTDYQSGTGSAKSF